MSNRDENSKFRVKINRNRMKKWDKKHMKTVAARLPIDKAEAFKALCQAKNTTRHAMIKAWIYEQIGTRTPGERVVNSTQNKSTWGQL